MDLLRRASTWLSTPLSQDTATASDAPVVPATRWAGKGTSPLSEPHSNRSLPNSLFDPSVHQIRFSSSVSENASSDAPGRRLPPASAPPSMPNRKATFHDAFDALEELDLEEKKISTIQHQQSAKPATDSKAWEGEKPSIESLPPLPYSFTTGTPENAPPKVWTYGLYKDLEGKCPTLELHRSLAASERGLQKFTSDTVLGFDMEWLPSFYKTSPRTLKHEVSLIQLASPTRIALFHFALFPGNDVSKLMPPTLKRILEDDRIAKVGVNIAGDARRLKNYFGVNVKGQFELSHLYKLVKYYPSSLHMVDRKAVNLAAQVEECFGLPLDKGPTRVSNWSYELTTDQAVYAGNDVYASVMLYWHMERKRMGLDPAPPRPEYNEKGLPIRFGDRKLEAEAVRRRHEEAKDRRRKRDERKLQADEVIDDDVDGSMDADNRNTAPNDEQTVTQAMDEVNLESEFGKA